MNQWISVCPHSQLFLNSVKNSKNFSQTLVLPTKIPDKYIQMTAFFHFQDVFGIQLRTKEDKLEPVVWVPQPSWRCLLPPTALCTSESVYNLRIEVRKNVDFLFCNIFEVAPIFLWNPTVKFPFSEKITHKELF